MNVRGPGRDATLRISECLGAATAIASVAEYVANPRDRRRGGLNDWVAQREAQRRSLPKPLFVLFDLSSRPPVALALNLFRGAAALVVLSGRVGRRARGLLQLGSAGAQLLLGPRSRYGSDGSDQALMQTTLAVGAARAVGTPVAADIALGHLALQTTMAYQAAGWTKLLNPEWGSGTALTGVMRTRAYGDERLWRLLRARPTLARVLSRTVLGFECAFVLVLTGRAPLTWLLTAVAASFHLAVGATMGLGRFATAFPAMLVSVPYVFGGRRDERQDRSVPRAFAGVIASAVAVGALTTGLRERRVRRAAGAALSYSAGNGCVIRFHAPTMVDAEDTCFVLFPGLGASHHHLLRLALELSRAGGVMVLADAVGGQRLQGREFADLREGLVEFVTSLAGSGRRVVLVGHSLGGHLAASVAAALPGPVGPLYRIDPTEPAVVDTDRRTNPTLATMAFVSPTLLLGGGLRFRRPRWTDDLPEDVRRALWDIQLSPCWWRRSTAIWRTMLAEWATGPTVERVTAPGMDIWSQQAAARWDGDFVDGESRAQVSVPRSNHHSVINEAEHAATVAARIIHDLGGSQ